MKWSIDFAMVEEQVSRMPLGFEAGSGCFRSAILLLAGLIAGQNVRTLSEYTGYSERWLVPRITRLRQAGIWGPHGQTVADWDDPLIGREAFLGDVLIAEGMVQHGTRQPAVPSAKGGAR